MPSHPPISPGTRVRNMADRIGMTASVLCAIHCAVTPLVLVALPSLSLWWASMEHLHGWLVGSLALFGICMTWQGWRRHQRFYAWAFLIPGLLALGCALLVPGETLEHVLMAVGGTLVACAHLVNLKLSHGHVHDACCNHRH